ncbi:hypothetical protein COE26_27610 [Bacillus cereus]|uniref:hypothetical protein n=1 Tax=Bacillus cereus TaxID=1396 RepID=UPI000BFC8055|nr:hypothetical protein [Bacillus cereus]PGW65308.1 hypothetical protein COE26_27610 [Bacillus cereus]
MIKEVSLGLIRFEIAYEIHKSLGGIKLIMFDLGTIKRIAKIKLKKVIKRRFKGANKIVIL